MIEKMSEVDSLKHTQVLNRAMNEGRTCLQKTEIPVFWIGKSRKAKSKIC